MQFGAHLPLVSFGGTDPSLSQLCTYTEQAGRLGYTYLCANDHLVFDRQWLDGPTALAAVIGASTTMKLATTVALPIVRSPTVTAKMLAAIDIMSGGRLIAGVGPGSSARDYALIGVPLEERWKRLDEAVAMLRALWTPGGPSFSGKYYMLRTTPHQRSFGAVSDCWPRTFVRPAKPWRASPTPSLLCDCT